MKITETIIGDVFIIDLFSFNDERGEFVKTIHDKTFNDNGLIFDFTESFFSVSKQNVIRGMHFQIPPFDHVKFVYVVSGSIVDVILDLRKNSPTHGKYICVELNDKNRKAIYIGKGMAHGFLSLENNTVVEYHTSTSQNKDAEGGILYNSFGYKWPTDFPIVSLRDNGFLPFYQFKTPF